MDVPTLVNRLRNAKKDRPLIWGKSKEDLTIYAKELLNKRKSDYEQADFKVNGKNLNVKLLVDLINKGVFSG